MRRPGDLQSFAEIEVQRAERGGAVARRLLLELRPYSGQLALKAGQPQPGSILLTFEVEDLPAELEHLARLGVMPEAPLKTSPEGYRRALLRDPDGYRLCLYDWKG